MDWGSQYVLEYDVSSDEYISDGELEEGMWLSDNSDEDLDMQCRPHVSPSSEELCPPLYASRYVYVQVNTWVWSVSLYFISPIMIITGKKKKDLSH